MSGFLFQHGDIHARLVEHGDGIVLRFEADGDVADYGPDDPITFDGISMSARDYIAAVADDIPDDDQQFTLAAAFYLRGGE